MYSSLLSLVFVTETWLSGSFFDNEILPTGYSIFRKDCHSQGGGVLIVVASHILSSFIYSRSYPDILTVKLLSPSPVILCVVYIPPLSSDTSWSSLLDYLCCIFTSSCLPAVVLGDFNCQDIDWPLLSASSSFSNLLCDLVYDFNLTQCISQPTHTKGNILDLILTNSEDIVSNVSCLQQPWSTSDHYSISFSLLVGPSSRFCSSTTFFLNYSQADYRGCVFFSLSGILVPVSCP